MPAVSKAQQRFMGMVHAVQKGDMPAPSKKVEEAAGSMSKSDATDFAETKHEELPEKKTEKKGSFRGRMEIALVKVAFQKKTK